MMNDLGNPAEPRDPDIEVRAKATEGAAVSGELRSEVPTAPNEAEKDKKARLEKFAQSHFDRAQSLSAGATKAALAWSVALGLIWFQVMEHRLTLVHRVQRSQERFSAISRSGADDVGTERLTEKIDEQRRKVSDAEAAAADQQIELPFSVKLTLPPYLVPTLWLLLALGLTYYLQDARRRILSLIKRGAQLHQEAGVEARFRTLVGGGVWWLAPLPTLPSIEDEVRHQTLGWLDAKSYRTVVACVAAMLVLLQARVQYVSLCVAAGLMPIKNQWPYSLELLALLLLNFLLGAVILIRIWRWIIDPVFERETVFIPEETKGVGRRRALQFMWIAAFAAVAFVLNIVAIYLFAGIHARKIPRMLANSFVIRAPMRRNHRVKDAPRLAFGLYANTQSGIVHISSPTKEGKHACGTSCLSSASAKFLRPVGPADVKWNEIRPSKAKFFSPIGRPNAPIPDRSESPIRNKNRGTYPHQSHRTFMVEQQAIAYLHAGADEKAIEFLLEAIQAVPLFGLRTGLRLYDLLAGLSIRYGKLSMMDKLLAAIRSEVGNLPRHHGSSVSLVSTQSPSKKLWFRYLLLLAGTEDSMESRNGPHGSRRRVRPRKRRSGKENTEAAQAKEAVKDRSKQLADLLEARTVKWTATDSRWAARWRSSGEIKWAGTTLRALPK
jgi:hypothetical protein